MFRATLIRVSEQEHILVIITHHIASDGWSLSVLAKEMEELYSAYSTGRTANLNTMQIQYADYALWQHNYWKKKLEGTTLLDLPTDYECPFSQRTLDGSYELDIDKLLKEELQELSRQQGVTLFMSLLAVFNVLMYQYTGQHDICIGNAIAGRTRKETEDSLGFFINMLAIRNDLSGHPAFVTFLQQVKETTLEAYEHQDVPFEKVVDTIKGTGAFDPYNNPFFRIRFMLQNIPAIPAFHIGEKVAFQIVFPDAPAELDLSIIIKEYPDRLSIGIAYCVALFKPETIEKMMTGFQQLLQAVVKSPEASIDALSVAPI
jgi:hypothetical protein